MRNPAVADYGAWRSPITAELLTARGVGLAAARLDGDDLYWCESRPSESGRIAVLRRRAGGAIDDLLPAPFSARTRAHEYGGGAVTVDRGVVYFCNDADQRVYAFTPGAQPRALSAGENLRFADLTVDRARARLIAVMEDYGAGGEPKSGLVAIDTARVPSAPRVLVAGQDFYSSPRISPDGTTLLWLAWDHPNMPWDGTTLWAARIVADGAVVDPRPIAGGACESVFQPSFAPTGEIVFVSDRGGWWNLHRARQGRVECLLPMAAEFGAPQWVFGMSTYAFAGPGAIVCAYCEAGSWRLGRVDTAAGRLTTIDAPYSDIGSLAADGGTVAFIASGPRTAPELVRLSLADGGREVVRRSLSVDLDDSFLSAPEAMRFDSAAGERAHAFFYPPVNPDFCAPGGARPPLIVISHGGPTSANSSALNLKTQYWTSRGFAVVDVNYRGSSGFGREYREKLAGRWGVADVEDCVHAARFLVASGRVDPARLAIRGGSAGGLTVLAALAFHDVFKAGAVYYGVADLEALAKDTHKFESRYLDKLIGPYPAARTRYRERSPVNHIERIRAPMIFFQGLQDKVVPPDQSERMVNALRAKGVPVAYLSFEQESHGFRRAETIERSLAAELSFYARVFRFTPAEGFAPIAIEPPIQ